MSVFGSNESLNSDGFGIGMPFTRPGTMRITGAPYAFAMRMFCLAFSSSALRFAASWALNMNQPPMNECICSPSSSARRRAARASASVTVLSWSSTPG